MKTDSEKSKRYGTYICKEERERLEKLTQEYMKTKEFIKFSDARLSLHIRLENALPEEFKSLSGEVDSLLTKILTAQRNYFYRNGFWNCCDYVREREEEAKKHKIKEPLWGVNGLRALVGYI